MIVKAIKTKVFSEGDDLFNFVTQNIKHVPEKSVIVVTSKIVALAERRTTTLKNSTAKEKLIRSESSIAVKTKHVWLTLKDGILMANAGIDESNARGKLILLPKNSFKSADALRLKLRKQYKVKNLGVLITDSHTQPLRAGVVGIALGYAGFHGTKDYRGKSDIFGRKFIFSQTNVADSLATAAVFLMGEGAEQQPLAVITGASIDFCEKVNPKELQIPPKDDMYGPLFKNFQNS
ncbi:MAG: coenzyme F420-0:L-glutamate ligase [Patescibacteria group bacterium]